MSKYNHGKIEKKWQQLWDKTQLYATPKVPGKNLSAGEAGKMYVLDMFPYPSGAGLHVGHPEGYTATDIYSRYLRMNGYDVLHPMGWDAFGLPAENYAIKEGIHPAKSTAANVKRFREQIKSLGLSYDWDREIDTSSPDYYKWTQWLFLKLFEKGLAYRKEAYVNWCPSCQTVLANEQVKDGVCERCETEVVQKLLPQWFFKITDYAERLLGGLEKIDWPEPIKLMQRNWIGKSEGAEIEFSIVIPVRRGGGIQAPGSRIKSGMTENIIRVFTTRPDTIFGATYMVLAPEHEIVQSLKRKVQNWVGVEKYIEQAKKKTELQRTALEKEKTGVELKGVKAINPATKEEIPIWIADYVLMAYGTGGIMAVPAHDQRDFAFAKKYKLPIREVVHNSSPPPLILRGGAPSLRVREGGGELRSAYEGEGTLINSGKFDGMESEKAKWEIAKFVNGVKKTQYKLRDWLISRQRYWGAPIPIIYCDNCKKMYPVPEKDLPVKLPTDVDFKPTGESPLARSKSFMKVKCPVCYLPARRETDTMDTFVDSAWYWLRYTDPKNSKEFASKKEIQKWCPVDTYVGGAEHAVLHLMYARFFCKALYDLGYLKFEEPFLKLRNQGLILGPGGQKMSKSRGNVINPDDVVDEFGADSMRMYEMFMGPLEDAKPWSTEGIRGVRRFLEKVWRVVSEHSKLPHPNPLRYRRGEGGEVTGLLHKTVKKVTEDIQSFKFNTAVSALMILANEFSNKRLSISDYQLEIFLKLLAPFAPHLAEELWYSLGHKTSIHKEDWPEYDEKFVRDELADVVVQVNGKLRATIKMPAEILEEEAKKLAREDINVQRHLAGKKIRKTIYVPGKIINFVIQ